MSQGNRNLDPDSLSTIIIVGSGVFGLSTALWLASRSRYASATITVIDKSPFPAPDGSSIDSSRIIRADYSDPVYATLAVEARTIWNHPCHFSRNDTKYDLTAEDLYAGVGENGRYSEAGLVLLASDSGQSEGSHYVEASYRNVEKAFGEEGGKAGNNGRRMVEWLDDDKAIGKVLGTGGSGGTGAKGYVNWSSGWADAEAAMVWTRQKCEGFPNVRFVTAEVEHLLLEKDEVKGVQFSNGEQLTADLTILAAGAWTAKLVDMSGHAVSTGQAVAYLKITEDEENRYRGMPVCLNLSNGVFVIPPRNGVLKVARHAYGYVNSTAVLQNGKSVQISLPLDAIAQNDRGLWIPSDAEEDLRQGLKDIVPDVADREFSKTRICWYTDTPKGDFIVSYHPQLKNLFLATGGSGHGFKFLPVLGSKIVDVIEGNAPSSLREKWKWNETAQEGIVTNDGSRSGSQRVDLQGLLRVLQNKL